MGELRIIGTAHVSKKSVEEVEAAIAGFRPSIVAVELDEGRYRVLKGDTGTPSIGDVLGRGNFNEMLVQWLLAYIQRRIGMDLGVEPGAEMKAAIEVAEQHGIPVALIDRDIRITLARFWGSMSLLEKLKLAYALVVALLTREEIDPDELTKQDMVSLALEEFRRFSPGGAAALIDERDAHIARALLGLQSRHERVLAVVGAGHVPGISKYLGAPDTIPPVPTAQERSRRLSPGSIIGVLFVLLFALLIAGLAFSGLGFGAILQAVLYWVVLHAVLAGLFALAAGGHPLSVLTACAVAWMTALNPLVAAGWFAAITEAKVRRPGGDDFRRIMAAEDFRAMWKVPLFRVVLVAALTNLGSTLATILYYFTVLPILGIDPAIVIVQGLGNLWNWLLRGISTLV